MDTIYLTSAFESLWLFFFVFVSHSASHGVFTKGLWEEIFCRMYTGTKTDIMNCYFLRSLIKEGYHSVG